MKSSEKYIVRLLLVFGAVVFALVFTWAISVPAQTKALTPTTAVFIKGKLPIDTSKELTITELHEKAPIELSRRSK